MNCEQGDTAYFKGCNDKTCGPCSFNQLQGRVMSCVRLNTRASAAEGEAMWVIDPPQPVEVAKGVRVIVGSIPDSHLRPIRGREGEDETLTWKDVPNKQHTT